VEALPLLPVGGDLIWYHGMQPEQRYGATRLFRFTLNHVHRSSSSLCSASPLVASLILPAQASSPAAEDNSRFVCQNDCLTLDDV